MLSPANENEAAQAVREARAARRTLEIVGGGSRRGLGRPVRADAQLSTAALTGVTLYEPAELVLSARAGAPVAEIEAILAAKGQMLPFEPMDCRPLYGGGGEPTIGAVAACNMSGPRRLKVGAARDSLIGVRFVNGAGETIKSGGRVMKNVTGLDLVKLACGAHGTLGVLTEVTFKLLPRPQRVATLVIEGLDDADAVAAMAAALATPFEVSGAAHLPGPTPRTLLRVEHFAPSVEYRLSALTTALTRFGATRRLYDEEAAALWREVRDGAPLAARDEDAVWRVSVPASRAPAFVQEIAQTGAARSWFYDWGGGLVWLATPLEAAVDGRVHRAAAGAKGHATLMRAPEATRERVDVFQPLADGLMAITKRVKASFDPDRALNPGRMYAGV